MSCWEDCAAGYTDIGIGCKITGGIKFYFRKSYFPSILNNFDAKVKCPDRMYKSGALCYRDCESKGMVNCGIGACALTKEGCYSGVLKITVDFLMGFD